MRRTRMAMLAVGTVLATLGGATTVAAAEPPAASDFDEKYQGRHIRGWVDALPCAFIDGVHLEVYEVEPGVYVSSVAAYEPTRGLAATARRAVEVLGHNGLADQGTPPHCR